MKEKLFTKVNEIFNSVSGEVGRFNQGTLATFVRFSGCNAKCKYCDTDHSSFTRMNSITLLNEVNKLYKKTGALCITGGEPLLNPIFVDLLTQTFKNAWIETNGLLHFRKYIKKIPLTVDYKLDFLMKKGYSKQTQIDDYVYLCEWDWIKFVIKNKYEFEQFLGIRKFLLEKECKANIAIAPVHGKLSPNKLIYWCFEHDVRNVTINVQLHKYIGVK